MFITNDDFEKPPYEKIRDVVSNMMTNELSNVNCSIEMFNGQKIIHLSLLMHQHSTTLKQLKKIQLRKDSTSTHLHPRNK